MLPVPLRTPLPGPDLVGPVSDWIDGRHLQQQRRQRLPQSPPDAAPNGVVVGGGGLPHAVPQHVLESDWRLCSAEVRPDLVRLSALRYEVCRVLSPPPLPPSAAASPPAQSLPRPPPQSLPPSTTTPSSVVDRAELHLRRAYDGNALPVLREYAGLLGGIAELLQRRGIASPPLGGAGAGQRRQQHQRAMGSAAEDGFGDGDLGGSGQHCGDSVPGLELPWAMAGADFHPLSAGTVDPDPDPAGVVIVRTLRHERRLALTNVAALEMYEAGLALAEGSSSGPQQQIQQQQQQLQQQVQQQQADQTPDDAKVLAEAQRGYGLAAATFAFARGLAEAEEREEMAERRAAAAAAMGAAGMGGGGAHAAMEEDGTANANAAPSDFAEKVGGTMMMAVPPPSPPVPPPPRLPDPSSVLQSFHLLSLAHGQMCVYRTALLRKRPMHTVLAKIASGAGDMYENAWTVLDGDDGGGGDGDGDGYGGWGDGGAADGHYGEVREEKLPGAAAALTAHRRPNRRRRRPPHHAQEYVPYLRSASALCRSKAETHEATLARDKNSPGFEVARLRRALRLAEDAEKELFQCSGGGGGGGGGGAHSAEEEAKPSASFVSSVSAGGGAPPHPSPPLLGEAFRTLLREIRTHHLDLRTESDRAESANSEPVPTDLETPRTRSQNMMKRLPPLHATVDPARLSLLVDPTNGLPPLRHVLDGRADAACTEFRAQTSAMLSAASGTVDEANGTAHGTLAGMNLPQGLDSYLASQAAGGGIPPRMAEQIRSVQSNNDIALLKHNLWVLRDVADVARAGLQEVADALDETVELDTTFRAHNPRFHGTDVRVAQAEARESVRSCGEWLEQARRGDAKLLETLELFETDPKFRLVQFPLEQLEQLVPAGRGGGRSRRRRGRGDETDGDENKDDDDGADGDDYDDSDDDDDDGSIDTYELQGELAALSALLGQRMEIIETFRDELERFELRPRLVEAAAGHLGNGIEDQPELFLRVAQESASTFHQFIEEVNGNVSRQPEILGRIMDLHKSFQRALDHRTSSGQNVGQAYIQKLEDALTTIEWIKPKLAEGRNFYDVVMPRLEQLKAEVADVNAQLAVERLEFEDRASILEDRRRQELEDEKIAQEFAKSQGHNLERRGDSSAQERKDEEMAAELARRFKEEARLETESSQRRSCETNVNSSRSPEEVGRPPMDFAGEEEELQGRRSTSGGRRLQRASLGCGPSEGTANTNSSGGSRIPRRRSSERLLAHGRAERRRSLEGGDAPPLPMNIDTDDTSGEAAEAVRLSASNSARNLPALGGNRRSLSGGRQDQQHAATSHDHSSTLPTPTDQPPEPSLDRNVGTISSNTGTRDSTSTSSADHRELVPPNIAPARAASQSLTTPPLPGRPGIYHVSNDEVPVVQVDDERFASLVQMDFDPDLVREALQRFDNNVEHALEYILQQM